MTAQRVELNESIHKKNSLNLNPNQTITLDSMRNI